MFSALMDAEITAILSDAMLLRAGYNTTVVMLGTAALGVAAGVVGTFNYMRKRALVADALSHATLPGICLAFIVMAAFGYEGRSLAVLLAGAAITGMACVLCVQYIVRHTRLSEDTAIGGMLGLFFGLGIVLLSYVQIMPSGGKAGINTFILGQTAAMNMAEAKALLFTDILAVIVALAMFKEFRLVCFDEEYATSQGWPVTRIDAVMAALTVLVTVIGLKTVGVILIIAMLIIPPVAARFWSDNLTIIVALASVFGGISGYIGAALSSAWPDLPAGAMIVLVAGVFFIVSMLFAPRRGLLAMAWRHAHMRLHIAATQALIRLDNAEGGNLPPGAMPVSARLLLFARGHATFDGRRMTDTGRTACKRDAANLRLWEAVLHNYRGDLPGHIVWGVDRAEDVLPPEILDLAKAHLAGEGGT